MNACVIDETAEPDVASSSRIGRRPRWGHREGPGPGCGLPPPRPVRAIRTDVVEFRVWIAGSGAEPSGDIGGRARSASLISWEYLAGRRRVSNPAHTTPSALAKRCPNDRVRNGLVESEARPVTGREPPAGHVASLFISPHLSPSHKTLLVNFDPT